MGARQPQPDPKDASFWLDPALDPGFRERSNKSRIE
jgi:hypothetical protein